MNHAYHSAVMAAQLEALVARAASDGWNDVTVEREEEVLYVGLSGKKPGHRYLASIDTSGYPVEPYWVGFLNPDLPRSEWRRVSLEDPRYWPWSPIPGLHGSFHTHFAGVYRAFWCRECTQQFFYYHGRERDWEPARWPLASVVANLRESVRRAEHPRDWRPINQPVLLQQAAALNVSLPQGAGIDDA